MHGRGVPWVTAGNRGRPLLVGCAPTPRLQSASPWVWVCGGWAGPYGGVLCDGSEYSGAYGVGPEPAMSVEALMAFHRPRVAAVAGTRADLVAFETIPCLVEGLAIAHLLATEFPELEAWISFSCSSGDTLVRTRVCRAPMALPFPFPPHPAQPPPSTCTQHKHPQGLVSQCVAP